LTIVYKNSGMGLFDLNLLVAWLLLEIAIAPNDAF
jgi:hypothetical protein